MSETAYKLGKFVAKSKAWIVPLVLLLSIALNVELTLGIRNAREKAEEETKRALVATEGLKATTHLLYLAKREAIATSCFVEAVAKSEHWAASQEARSLITEYRKVTEANDLKCRELEPERSVSGLSFKSFRTL